MRSFTAIAALSAFASTVSADYFTAISLRSASPVHFLPLTASGQRLHLGGKTGAYCPEQAGSCPNSTYTSLAASNTSSGLSMGAIVPGGQQVYINNSTGAVSYTQAHSAYFPPGAIRDGWTYTVEANGQGRLSWKNGLVACPTKSGVYDIHAVVPNVKFIGDCLGFSILTQKTQNDGPTQWQYI